MNYKRKKEFKLATLTQISEWVVNTDGKPNIPASVDKLLIAAKLRKDDIPRNINAILDALEIVAVPYNFKKIESMGLKRVDGSKIERGSISAAVVQKNDIPTILYRQSTSVESIRFAVAHELGHIILHTKAVQDDVLFLQTRSHADVIKDVMPNDKKNIVTATKEQEKQAEDFANELTMPESSFYINYEQANQDAFDDLDLMEKLVKKYRVTYMLMEQRINNLTDKLHLTQRRDS